jgi:small subunit ribosomal protein S1
MDWTNKNVNPNKVVALGDEVEVMILEIDSERRRISLGMKQCQSNPWDEFASRFNKGDVVKGAIKSITDFGVFVGLDGGIDGLVHLSDISWNMPGEEAVRNYKKGEEIEATVLSIDPERERISLGIKQLDRDPFSNFVAEHPKGSIVRGKVSSVDAKAAVIDLGEEDGLEGILKASELSRDRVEDARSVLNEGDEVEAKLIGIDRKSRSIMLSIKAKESDEEAAVLQDYSGSEGATTSLGDILKEQMDTKED